MWWEDEKTLGPKVDLAKRYSLGGLAVLKLNFSDQAYWTALGKYLGR
jgi:spore germination protein YaaH